VSDVVSTIAAAVEQQSATTQSMAGDVSNTAEIITHMTERFTEVNKASKEIATDIDQVTALVQEIDQSSTQVEGQTGTLSSSSHQLKSIVDKFKLSDAA
ncbi:MAG: hypothetical protein AAGI88_26395, partial [Pseudomonadota bacterium]